MNQVATPGLSPVQAGVQIVQNMLQCGMGGDTYEDELSNLHGLMSEFALGQIRDQYESHLREAQPLGEAPYVLTIEEVTSEANENTPMAEAYWAATSAFFRKVYQAAAAAA